MIECRRSQTWVNQTQGQEIKKGNVQYVDFSSKTKVAFILKVHKNALSNMIVPYLFNDQFYFMVAREKSHLDHAHSGKSIIIFEEKLIVCLILALFSTDNSINELKILNSVLYDTKSDS